MAILNLILCNILFVEMLTIKRPENQQFYGENPLIIYIDANG